MICVSLGASNKKDCGWVTDDWLSYTINAEYGGYTLFGGDYDRMLGDSGSPAFRDGQSAVAIGLHSTDTGKFARIDGVLNNWGWNIVT